MSPPDLRPPSPVYRPHIRQLSSFDPTYGILEGLNSKIQLAKKRARVYGNINNFINIVYFTCGKLKFNYPLYLT